MSLKEIVQKLVDFELYTTKCYNIIDGKIVMDDGTRVDYTIDDIIRCISIYHKDGNAAIIDGKFMIANIDRHGGAFICPANIAKIVADRTKSNKLEIEKIRGEISDLLNTASEMGKYSCVCKIPKSTAEIIKVELIAKGYNVKCEELEDGVSMKISYN